MDAVQLIEDLVKRLARVLSKDYHVVGELTDRDIRCCPLNTLAIDMINVFSVIVSVNVSDSSLRHILDKNNLRPLCLVDDNNWDLRSLYESEFPSDVKSKILTEKTLKELQ
jgi:hypothetical protein